LYLEKPILIHFAARRIKKGLKRIKKGLKKIKKG